MPTLYDRREFLELTVAGTAASLAGCADDDETSFPPPPPQGPLEIIGNYTDNFGGTQQVTQTRWVSGTLGFQIRAYSNAGNFLAAQNDLTNAFSPGKFSRFSWTTFQASLYFCQNPFSAETFEAAFSGAPDSTDPNTGGCGGFSWTQLTPL